MDWPLISIIIPVFNGSNYLEEAINSALSQTYKNIEIVVINDGSNDNEKTRMVALSFGDSIQYFEKENGGVSSALNYGVRHSRGAYIAWLSHDDLFSPNKIQYQMLCLKKNNYNPNVIPFCDSYFIDKNKKKELSLFNRKRKRDFKGLDAFFPLNVCFASCLFPKELLVKHPFNEFSRYTQDIEEFYDCLYSGYEFKRVKNCFYIARNHENRVTHTRVDLFEDNMIAFHKKMMSDIRKNNLFSFAKKYLYYACQKKAKYSVFVFLFDDIKAFLKSANRYNLFTRIKCYSIYICSIVGYKMRKVLSSR